MRVCSEDTHFPLGAYASSVYWLLTYILGVVWAFFQHRIACCRLQPNGDAKTNREAGRRNFGRFPNLFVEAGHHRAGFPFLFVAVLIFLASTPVSAEKSRKRFLGTGAQTGVCTARGFAQFSAKFAQVILDVISVRISLEIFSGTSVLSLGI